MNVAAHEWPWPMEIERELLADVCYHSFYHFCLYAMGFAYHPEGFWFTERVHKPLCDWLQEHAEAWFRRRKNRQPGRMNLIVCVPREFGKSMVVTKAFNLWLHLHESELSTVIDSVDADHSKAWLQSIQKYMSGDEPHSLFTWLYGNWRDPKRKWNTNECVHAYRKSLGKTEASIDTCSVTSGITGYHPDLIFVDDPITEEKLKESGNWNDTANRHMASLIPAIKANGAIVLIGTRYLDNDPIGTCFREGIASISGMPMRDERIEADPVKGKWHVYFLQAEKGGTDDQGLPIPVLPEAKDAIWLHNYKKSHPIQYACQMMNEPALSEHNPITDELLQRMYITRDMVPNNVIITIHCDTAFRHKKRVARSDDTVIEVWGHASDGSGMVYFLEGYGSPAWSADTFADKIVTITHRYKQMGYHIRCITDELEPGGKEGVTGHWMQSVFDKRSVLMPPFCQIRRHGSGRNKVQRIMDAALYWQELKVFLVKDAPGCSELVSQMSRIGVAAHDDWADAAADVFSKESYRPSNRFARDNEDYDNVPLRAWDDVLIGRRGVAVPEGHSIRDPRIARLLYDQYMDSEEDDDLGVPGIID